MFRSCQCVAVAVLCSCCGVVGGVCAGCRGCVRAAAHGFGICVRSEFACVWLGQRSGATQLVITSESHPTAVTPHRQEIQPAR